MADAIRDLLFGGAAPARELVEAVEPRRSFDDVVLPATTMRALNHALALVRKHDLIFHQWGLSERHSTGVGLAFHFAGPPGTGKTVCAEALAYALGKKLLVVRYAELESRWVGQTSKHVSAVFRSAARQDAVLFFDEADAIAGRRFTSVTAAYEREANAIVNVLLHELESFPGVVIFATNLAANIDPAFERRIRTHILFDMPNVEERERIWRVQLHARKTPLADDVDFAALAEAYPRSGGDIKNAVLKAAQIATVEPGPDADKRIHQRHFVQGIEEVIAGEAVMAQSLFDAPSAVAERVGEAQEELRGEIALLAERFDGLEKTVRRVASEQSSGRSEIERQQSQLLEALSTERRRSQRLLLIGIGVALILAIAALVVPLLHAQSAPDSSLAPAMVQGVLATPDDELNSAFSPDGKTVYFSKNLGDRTGVILVSRWTGGKWGTPEVASFSGRFSDYDPFMSPDGSRLYWISNRPVGGTAKDDYDIWVVEKQGKSWGEPMHLPDPINTDAQEFYPTVATDGTLYFSSTRPGGKGRGDIYRARRDSIGFSAPESLGDSVNSALHDADPYIAPDQSFIIFTSYNRPDGAGDGDLYVSYNHGGQWSSARHLENGINSAAREYCPIVSPDGRWLYFTSFRGLLDTPPATPLTYDELSRRLRTPLNGSGNVYRIAAAAFAEPATP